MSGASIDNCFASAVAVGAPERAKRSSGAKPGESGAISRAAASSLTFCGGKTRGQRFDVGAGHERAELLVERRERGGGCFGARFRFGFERGQSRGQCRIAQRRTR
jgi:hypothetical protein